MLLLQIRKTVFAVGDKVPAGVELATAHVFPPSVEVISNAHDHGTLAIGTKMAPVRFGLNMTIMVKESVLFTSTYPGPGSFADGESPVKSSVVSGYCVSTPLQFVTPDTAPAVVVKLQVVFPACTH
jgi:hypothetical protein